MKPFLLVASMPLVLFGREIVPPYCLATSKCRVELLKWIKSSSKDHPISFLYYSRTAVSQIFIIQLFYAA